MVSRMDKGTSSTSMTSSLGMSLSVAVVEGTGGSVSLMDVCLGFEVGVGG